MKKAVFLAVAVCLAVAPALFAGDYVVLFKGEGVPAGFANTVAALGGTVVERDPHSFAYHRVRLCRLALA